MFGRQIFLEPVDNQRNHRYNEFLRQFSANQGHGVPFVDLLNVPSLRNDGLMLDLNFILVEDNDHGQPNNLHFPALVFACKRFGLLNKKCAIKCELFIL